MNTNNRGRLTVTTFSFKKLCYKEKEMNSRVGGDRNNRGFILWEKPQHALKMI